MEFFRAVIIRLVHLTHIQHVCQFQSCIKEGFLLKQTGSFQVSNNILE